MPATPTLFVCSCEDTMPLDAAGIGRACGQTDTRAARFLCRTQRDLFQNALGDSSAITVACTQEAPLFEEMAEDAGFTGSLTFVNIRETAGWSQDAAKAMPKMAALIAAAQEPRPAPSFVPLQSKGALLIYGRDTVALDAARQLAERLDVSVVLQRGADVAPLAITDIPVFCGKIRNAHGYLGAFVLTVDDFAESVPSSRHALQFSAGRNGAVSNADIILDLTGGAALLPAHELRAGYVRANPGDAAAVQRAIFDVGGLTGTFDKPRYVNFNESLCAHSRSGKTGCTRCLDLCPTGAITPNGNTVAISAEICAGCGACAAVCPTGAAAYALPPADALMRSLRTLLHTYGKAGGKNAVVLFHDGEHGMDLIHAQARHGDGLPAHVLPVAINESTQLGFETLVAATSFGARAVCVLTRAKPKHNVTALERALSVANALTDGLGFGACAHMIAADDPDVLLADLMAIPLTDVPRASATLLPMGDSRSVMKQALRGLYDVAPQPADIIALPEKAPFGTLSVNTDGCTLCLACVSACPVSALGDNPDKPQLTFREEVCVQCGLCAATCPEKVITLTPRLNFPALDGRITLIKEEEPFHCIACNKAFGTRSTIERVIAKLQSSHWMFAGEGNARADMLRMCEDCRVGAVTNANIDPYASTARAPVRTTDDYLRERALREAKEEGNA